MRSTLLSTDTTVQTALRLRPRLAENLHVFGGEAWDRPHATLLQIFRNRDTLEKFLEMASDLPVPGRGSAWRALPASHLIDHLTQNHREFFGVTLPDIHGFFRQWDGDGGDPGIADLREDFDAFARGLRAEIESEESLFFPRVLRYEACMHHPSVNPEFNGGSLRVAVAYRRGHAPGLHPNRLGSLIERMRDRLRETQAVRDGNPWADLLIARLEDFRDQFEEHERLESEVLYPMAMETEKNLYNLSISGVMTAAMGAMA